MPNVLVEADQTMWTLSPTARRSASRCRRFRLRAWPNLSRHLEFDAGAVDAILEGLILLRGQMLRLRGQMLPPLKRN
jgi:hypothetical protein